MPSEMTWRDVAAFVSIMLATVSVIAYLVRLGAKVGEQADRLQKLDAEVKPVISQQSTLQTKHDTLAAEVRVDIASLKNADTEQKVNYNMSNSELKKLQTEVTGLTIKVGVMEQQLIGVERAITKMDNKLDAVLEKLNES